MKQRTLRKEYKFEGKGLHSGLYSHICIKPAPENTGVVFFRSDCGKSIAAVADNVSLTARSTTISDDGVSVGTIEHILSALTGLGVDNAVIEVDCKEVPILDGSAAPYTDAISTDGLQEQNAERVWLELDGEVDLTDPKTGAGIKIIPDDDLSYESTVDFNSRVLGIQTAGWDMSVDYSSQVAPCRTFCFLHEIQMLVRLGLVKGGDVRNAIIVVEKPASDCVLDKLSKMFNQPRVEVTDKGYLSNLELRFENECGRHKLLDLIGDLRLAGGFLKARVVAYKPGHSINTKAAVEIRKHLK